MEDDKSSKRKVPNHPSVPNKSQKLSALDIIKQNAAKFAPPPPSTSSVSIPGVPEVHSKDQVIRQKQYHEKYTNLLKMVLEDEIQDVRTRLEKAWKHNQQDKANKWLQSEGLAILGLRAKQIATLFNEVVIKFYMDDDKDIPFHRFTSGDMIMMSYSTQNPLNGGLIEGYIQDKTKRYINAVFQKVPVNNLEESRWRLDKSANKVTYDRMIHAIDTLCLDTANMKGGTVLRDLLVGNVKDFEGSASLPPKNFHSLYSNTKNFPENFKEWLLNDSQRNVIKTALSRRLVLIQGPPGTGKTHTAVHLVRLIVHIFTRTNKKIPILCVADTNVAVDNLLEGLCNFGINALRVGKPVKIREELRDRSVEGQMQDHPKASALQRMKDEHYQLLSDHKKMRQNGGDNDQKFVNPAIETISSRIREVEAEMAEEILSSTEVICATCIGCGYGFLAEKKFPVVLIDEATQATEPASLCAIVKGSEHLIMLGDHYQLPPTVTSPRAAEGGLSESLFQRLINKGVKSVMLDTQYRMHPLIVEFPSREFYHGKIMNGVGAESRLAPKGFHWPSEDKPLAFVSLHSQEHKNLIGNSNSKCNKKEAEHVVEIVNKILDAGELTTKDIGILTPYSGQVRLLTELFELNGGLGKGQRYHKLNINSIDGFQGREKELIIFSTVRSNSKGKVGFLSDWRRLNVALTRARRAEIILGNIETLSADKVWKQWLDYVKELNCIVEKK